jgi:hypothetical protein
VSVPRDPLSYAQRRLWFLNRLEGPSGTYVIPLAVRVKGRLEVAALEGALNDVVERHESLRTVFPDRLGVTRQEILAGASARVGLEVSRLSEAELSEAVRQACGRGFDVSRELPLRAHLYVLGEAEQVLLVVLHHIAGGRLVAAAAAAGTWQSSTGHGSTGMWRGCRCFRFNTRTIRFGSGRCLARRPIPAACWRGSCRTGVIGLEGLPEQIELPAARARPAVCEPSLAAA